MSDYIIHDGTLMSLELYHHGVKGMKWGVRKKEARAEYKQAKRIARAKGSAEDEAKAKAKYAKDMAKIKDDKKYFRTAVKAIKEANQFFDTIEDRSVTSAVADEITRKKGEEYCNKVIKTANKEMAIRDVAMLAGALSILGAGIYLETTSAKKR